MNEPKPFASLTPSLLARKGGARPAMRPQLSALHTFYSSAAVRPAEEDLGWNDMGDTGEGSAQNAEPVQAEIVQLLSPVPTPPARNAVAHAQNDLAERIVISAPTACQRQQRRSALEAGRRAAFTLRIDADRHLRLRLACTLAGRSAQQLITDALDILISELPDVAALAANVRNGRN